MESQSNGRPSSRTTTSPDHDGTSNETSDILRWLMLNRLEVSQVPERGNFIVKPPRANHGARARKRFRSVALTSAASISTRREYVGTDVFIVIGLGITFVGTAIALVGFFVPFGNTELRPLVLGIGLAVVATGLIVAGVRIFNCRPYKIRTCCCSKAERFPHLRKAFVHPVPMRISISSVSSSASSLRTLNKDNSTFIIPHSDKSKIMLKSSFRSSSKPVTANTVNFNPTVGEFSVENGSKELAWHSEISLISEELSKKIITNQDPSSYLELRTPSTVETIRVNNNDNSIFQRRAPWSDRNLPFERYDLTAGTERKLNEGLDKTRKNSANFHEDFSKTIKEMVLK